MPKFRIVDKTANRSVADMIGSKHFVRSEIPTGPGTAKFWDHEGDLYEVPVNWDGDWSAKPTTLQKPVRRAAAVQ